MSSNIGVVSRSLASGRGGQEKYMLSLVDELIEQGFKLTMVCEEAEPGLDRPAGSEVKTVTPIKVEQGIRKWLFSRRARSLLEREAGLDLIITTGHVNFGDLYIANGGSHRAYLRQCGSWRSWLGLKNWIQVHLQDELFSDPDRHFLTHSRMARNDIVREHDTDPERIHTIYHGVDLDRFNPETHGESSPLLRKQLGYEVEDFICLFTAGSWKRKGLPELLQAFAEVRNPGVHLLVVGRTKQSRAKRLASSLQVGDRVRFQGYVEDIEKFYRLSDALIFPSKYDAAGLVVLEALACGLPVVTTKTTGMHEVIEDGRNGFVIPSADDREALGDRIDRLAGMEKSHYADLRKEAARTGQQFPLGRHTTKFVKLIEELITIPM